MNITLLSLSDLISKHHRLKKLHFNGDIEKKQKTIRVLVVASQAMYRSDKNLHFGLDQKSNDQAVLCHLDTT